ncbi:MAG: diguanylate cyclase, partial [Thermotogae bacterium]
PYRDPLSVEKALNEIMKNKKTQFDPNLADAFVQMIMSRSA